MTAIRHHIGDELLVSYAAGALSEGWSIAVATHMALCPQCRDRALAAEAVGGAMLAGEDTAPAGDNALADVLGRIADERPIQAGSGARADTPTGDLALLPEPLRSYVGAEGIRWRKLGTSAHTMLVPTGDRDTKVRLLKIGRGTPVPEHGHRGLELTLVLSGYFRDGDQVFARGDVEEADAAIQHQPLAGPDEDCICLAVTDAPLRFKSLIGKLIQPFLRI